LTASLKMVSMIKCAGSSPSSDGAALRSKFGHRPTHSTGAGSPLGA